MKYHPTKTIITGLSVILLAAGCQREQVQVYRVDKDPAPLPVTATITPSSDPTPPAATALPPDHPDVSAATATPDSTGPLTWTTPTDWTEVPPSEIRVASFKITQDGRTADVSVIPLGGMAGGDSANVNRWRGQVGLSALSEDEIQKSADPVEIGGQPASLYDAGGASDTAPRIIGAIQHRDDTAWFFKLAGDGKLVEQQKAAFVEFLKSVKFAGMAPAQAGLPATLPPGHPDISNMGNTSTDTTPISHEGQPNWQVPTGWREVSGGQFLAAKFLLTNDGGIAAVNVSRSAGDGGGLAANVNRWRGQLGLPPVTDVSTSPVDVAGGTGSLVDLSGTSAQTGQPVRLVAVIVTQADNAWFYKLMGEAKVVENQKDAFVKFVQGAKY